MKFYQCIFVSIVILATTDGFKMPTLENIGDFFRDLAQGKAKRSVTVQENFVDSGEHFEEEEKRAERVKRQGIVSGDQAFMSKKVQELPRHANGSINYDYMPVLANGYIGTTAFQNSLFLNGIYSGKGGNSHRAKIPAIVMSQIYFDSPEQERETHRSYSFNARTGVFMEEIDSELGVIEHRLYTHNNYVRVLISDIRAKRKRQWGGVFKVRYPVYNDTKFRDIVWQQRQLYEHAYWKIRGTVKDPESAGAKTETVSIFWAEPVPQISLSFRKEDRFISYMSVDKLEAAAQSDFDAVRRILESKGQEGLLKDHEDSWTRTWSNGKVEVETGEIALARAVEFSQYYLISSMSPVDPKNPPGREEPLYGVGRGSLGKGTLGKDYQGHVFWDNEMYIMPAVLLFHPELAKKQLRYRAFHKDTAKRNAEASGDKGFRFPWESAYTGQEVTPAGTCDGCARRQIHVTAAVGYALRQYYSATRDQNFKTDPLYSSCEMSTEIARFFFNRAKYNTSIGRYDIKDVMGPDDYHDHVNNNVYTNAAASLAIHWARYYACICEKNIREEVPDEWIQTALYLELPFSNVERTHHQYEGFTEKNGNVTNKQADTILLTYPLNWNMSTDISKNDLERYEKIIDPDSPAMTWSWFAIGFKWVKNDQKKYSYFTKSYSNYMHTDFNIWTEYPTKKGPTATKVGAVNYLPGMGAFLQSIIYGFAGIRIRPESLEFHDPQPPPRCTRVTLRQLQYLGSTMTVEISDTTVEITVHSIGPYPLILKYNDTSEREQSLNSGALIKIEPASQGFIIFSNKIPSCDHPRDYIFMPWGYSPWIAAGTTVIPHVRLLVTMLIVTLFLQNVVLRRVSNKVVS